MYPWLWLWAPRIQFPWSGAVTQDIEPSTSWFFDGIKPDAGHAQIEEKAFAVASYGKQLGLITDVLLELAENALPPTAPARQSMHELKRIQAEIEKIKQLEYDGELKDIEGRIRAIQRKGGTRLADLQAKLNQFSAEK
jgi:hypothetical protein